MEKKKFVDSDFVQGFGIDTTFEIKMQDFGKFVKTVREEKHVKHTNSPHELIVNISICTFPNGADKDTEAWLVVNPDVYFKQPKYIYRPTNSALSWVVSLIDIEGDSRFPQSFEGDCCKGFELATPPDADLGHLKYLERSFILKRADEFLPNDVLTLRCDVHFHLFKASLENMKTWFFRNQLSAFQEFFDLFPQRVCFGNDGEMGDPRDTFTVFDLTSKVVTSKQFTDFIEGLGFNDDSPKLASASSESKEDITDDSEHVWIFEARPDKFILSLDERKDTVGTRLLKASSLIRECVSIPLKGQQENRVVLQKADSETFRIVLYLLAVGAVRDFKFFQLVKVYKFCHFYEMGELKRICAKCAADLEVMFETEFKELERIADLYSDEYLSVLLESRRRGYEKSERDVPRFGIEEIPCVDCYI